MNIGRAFAAVARLLEAAHAALAVRECTV